MNSSNTTTPNATATDRIAKRLEEILQQHPEQFGLVQALRELVLGLAPSIFEEVKYGGFLFSTERAFCGIFSYAKHVSLEFGAGASMPDELKILEGKGEQRRHIKLSSVQQITEKHVHDYLRLALDLTSAQ